ncbi:acyl-CoA dehydrogenase [Thauera linaloolentis]|uniref:Acyl-coenzyme A dehydrogenase n=1 Tax=Thauera linaloolentis (strain DSM 12138 / JCM 21573 / CCUG 41526 / CIP 105981 / IAM 15112 / NBRC 102519 / 47Lol) TaxID=1123367 RepID=N6YDS2_THAL4|nr:acyl-CoA dehydrogenase [Thauera linaloolentis]ENO89690.1 acyl-CoA dehydrogenase [Thauera linaloolentis 47Lol = DSM 12138]MCM8567170.1 acyl-CoA dehydrogenase [Thauera linaloolentis]
MVWLLLVSLPPLAGALAYGRAPLFAWLLAGLVWLAALGWAGDWPVLLTLLALALYAGAMSVFLVDSLRRQWVTAPIFKAFRKALPAMSQTEKDALEAGTVWWEGELFSGDPDWRTLDGYPWPKLSAEEQSFLDNEVDALCRLTRDWDCTQRQDMPPEVWRYIKDKGFLGMIIPREYGGKGFSAYAHSQVITKLSTRSSAPAVTVMVPNSLGPAELLLHYGTPEQKQRYLPGLASGREIPAFALTSPWAGSDAASIPDAGVVCKGMWQGEEVLGMRVSFDKRYITLAPVCTVFGLAFRLYDPDGLLGGEADVGITCALVPHEHPGVDIGRRHFPLNAVWMNGPVRGRDVFMPLDFIIGGPAMAGQGWRMLMECLAAGRSISLPGSNVGMQKLTARTVGAYARVRYQFKTQIGRFEGVEEALTRIGANTYLCDAARTMTAAAIDLGEKPSVVSAIVKYHVTERARQVVNDGMDVIGGKGICLGPQNFLGRAYQQIPVGITVEGANILTRSLILFGQGAIRCHPFVLTEMDAAQRNDEDAFDKALWSHVSFTVGNAGRAFVMGLTGSHFVRLPMDVAPETRRYYQQLTRFSAAFAFIADISMGTLGGALKRKEKLSARLGDILSLMYLATATLKRFEAEGRQAADAPLMHWAIWDCMFRIQLAFEGVIANFPNRLFAFLLRRLVVFPLGRPYVVPSDRLGHEVAALLIGPSATRDRLTADVHLPDDVEEPVGALEAALLATVAAEPIEDKLKQALRSGAFKPGLMTGGDVDEVWRRAREAGVITEDEYLLVERRNTLRDKVIRVDDFPYDFGLRAALDGMPASSPAREEVA